MIKSEYYLTPEWKAKAKECKLLANNKCSKCGSEENLHAHHLHYDTLGYESQSDLKCLCNKCHSIEHGFEIVVDKYPQRGHKMYTEGVARLVPIFTQKEMLQVIEFFSSKDVDYYNILRLPFSKVTPKMSKAARSRFKKKLIENEILGEYNKKLMLNPYIFLPRGDKNLRNCNYLTQRSWKYLFEDNNALSDGVQEHIDFIFGKSEYPESNYIRVGKEEYAKIIRKPEVTTNEF